MRTPQGVFDIPYAGEWGGTQSLKNPQSPEPAKGRLIGEVLLQQGLLTKEQLTTALDEQSLTGEKLWEILIRREWVTQQAFSRVMKDSGKKIRLWESLVDRKFITQDQLSSALERQRTTGKPLGEILLEMKAVEEHVLLSTISRQLGIQYLDVSKDDFAIIDPELRKEFPGIDRSFWISMRSLPVFFIESLDAKKDQKDEGAAFKGHLSVVMFDPLNQADIEKIEKATNCIVNAYVCGDSAIRDGIDKLYSGRSLSISWMEAAEATKFSRYLNKLLHIATLRGASDIHLEPSESEVVVRMRINGRLKRVDSYPTEHHKKIINVIKTSANLDISKHRVPQDGSFTRALGGHVVDVRVSTMPYVHGERPVLRILLQDMSRKSLFDSNLPPRVERQIVNALKKKNGVILVTGPTGSGKTTTLHRALQQVASEQVNVVTVEDPVEYRAWEHINQSSINERQGFTYPVAIRSILRQDPDVILVGEIRDKETAQVATEAALTGHLVLSTLHTEDSLGSIVRLIQLGVAEWLISSTVVTVINQRLIRRFCDCAEDMEEFPWREFFRGREIDENVVDSLEKNWKHYLVKRPVGCKKCDGEGYQGMQVVVEQLTLTSKVRDMIREGKTYREVIDYIREAHSMNMIFEEGFRQVLLGVTSFEELRDLPRGDYMMKSPDEIIRDATETREVSQVDLGYPSGGAPKNKLVIVEYPHVADGYDEGRTLPMDAFSWTERADMRPPAAKRWEASEAMSLNGFVWMSELPPEGSELTEVLGLGQFAGTSVRRSVPQRRIQGPALNSGASWADANSLREMPENERKSIVTRSLLQTIRTDQSRIASIEASIRSKTKMVLEAFRGNQGKPELWAKTPGVIAAMATMRLDRRDKQALERRIEKNSQLVGNLLWTLPGMEDTMEEF